MRRNNMPVRSHGGGPLMTDHIQLHELDLELELLKRKREMIEKQQQMLGSHSFSRPRPFNYDNQPQPLFPGLQQYSPNNGYGGLLGKRPGNDQPWQTYYSGPPGGAKRKFNSGPGPRPTHSKPAHAGVSRPYPQNRFQNPKTTKPAQRDFKPTKVGKPKPAPPVNKIGSYSTPERAKLVKKTIQSVKSVEAVDDDFILRENKVPTQQLAGRLELALGNIVKEIKTKYSENSAVNFQSMFLQRKMKQSIRERLRSVMMGKYVGKVDTIIEQYRKVFPVDTDSEIVQIAMEAHESTESKQLAIKLENAGTAYEYIKQNLNRLLGVTLDDMFGKVQKLYVDENENTKDICSKILVEKLPEMFNQSGTQETDHNESKGSETDVKNDEDANNSAPKDAENDAEEKDAETEVKDTATTAVENQQDDQIKDAETVENNQNKSSDELNTTEDETKPTTEQASTKLDYLILSLLRRRLPHILPKYKNMLMKVLNVSGPYQVTKNVIVQKAQEKQNIDRRIKEAETNAATNKSGEREFKPPAPYLVKIFGKPVLPKRRIMQTFLNNYKPAAIKKHKTMHLLFVAFRNKEDFDKIVAVKEITLGDSTVTIKVSEKMAANSDASLNTTVTSLNDSTEEASTITTELDEQINDLLLSIRKEEENKDDVPAESDTNGTQVDNDNETAVEEVAPEENTEGAVESTNEDAPIEEKTEETEEAKDRVEELKGEAKESGRTTPTRSSSRLANVTPSSVRTRRASRLANN